MSCVSAGNTANPSSSSGALLVDSNGPPRTPPRPMPSREGRAGVLNIAVVRGGDGMAGEASLHVVCQQHDQHT
jgi:hypothetical protein